MTTSSPCAPASAACSAMRTACAVSLDPAPATTYARSPTASTTAATTSAFSGAWVVGRLTGRAVEDQAVVPRVDEVTSRAATVASRSTAPSAVIGVTIAESTDPNGWVEDVTAACAHGTAAGARGRHSRRRRTSPRPDDRPRVSRGHGTRTGSARRGRDLSQPSAGSPTPAATARRAREPTVSPGTARSTTVTSSGRPGRAPRRRPPSADDPRLAGPTRASASRSVSPRPRPRERRPGRPRQHDVAPPGQRPEPVGQRLPGGAPHDDRVARWSARGSAPSPPGTCHGMPPASPMTPAGDCAQTSARRQTATGALIAGWCW